MTNATNARRPLPAKIMLLYGLPTNTAHPARETARRRTEGNRPMEGSQRTFGGDKIGFARATISDTAPNPGELKSAQDKFLEIVKQARVEKKLKKDTIEKWKESILSVLDEVDKEILKLKKADVERLQKGIDSDRGPYLLTHLPPSYRTKGPGILRGLKFPDSPKIADIKRAQDEGTLKWQMARLFVTSEKAVTDFSKVVLREWHKRVAAEAGWNWKDLSATFTKEFEVSALTGSTEKGHATISLKGTPVGTVYFGEDRLVQSKVNADVFEQQGSDDDDIIPQFMRESKQYVRDANGIPTRRFVYRQISHFHLAKMLGFDYEDKTKTFKKVLKDLTTANHEPRGNAEKFGAQTETFDINDVAVVGTNDHEGRYRVDPAAHDTEVGVTARRATPQQQLNEDSTMTDPEKNVAQIRNGSGRGQAGLSAASAQPLLKEALTKFDPRLAALTEKIIRGNKGAAFADSHETVAVLKIDLAKAVAKTVKFTNNHAAASHKFKVAWARYKEASAAQKLEIEQGKRTRKDILGIKREAVDELDEYIYSAEKNREIVFNGPIPNSIIDSIKLAYYEEKWAPCELTDVEHKFDKGTLDKIEQRMNAGVLADLLIAAERANVSRWRH